MLAALLWLGWPVVATLVLAVLARASGWRGITVALLERAVSRATRGAATLHIGSLRLHLRRRKNIVVASSDRASRESAGTQQSAGLPGLKLAGSLALEVSLRRLRLSVAAPPPAFSSGRGSSSGSSTVPTAAQASQSDAWVAALLSALSSGTGPVTPPLPWLLRLPGGKLAPLHTLAIGILSRLHIRVIVSDVDVEWQGPLRPVEGLGTAGGPAAAAAVVQAQCPGVLLDAVLGATDAVDSELGSSQSEAQVEQVEAPPRRRHARSRSRRRPAESEAATGVPAPAERAPASVTGSSAFPTWMIQSEAGSAAQAPSSHCLAAAIAVAGCLSVSSTPFPPTAATTTGAPSYNSGDNSDPDSLLRALGASFSPLQLAVLLARESAPGLSGSIRTCTRIASFSLAPGGTTAVVLGRVVASAEAEGGAVPGMAAVTAPLLQAAAHVALGRVSVDAPLFVEGAHGLAPAVALWRGIMAASSPLLPAGPVPVPTAAMLQQRRQPPPRIVPAPLRLQVFGRLTLPGVVAATRLLDPRDTDGLAAVAAAGGGGGITRTTLMQAAAATASGSSSARADRPASRRGLALGSAPTAFALLPASATLGAVTLEAGLRLPVAAEPSSTPVCLAAAGVRLASVAMLVDGREVASAAGVTVSAALHSASLGEGESAAFVTDATGSGSLLQEAATAFTQAEAKVAFLRPGERARLATTGTAAKPSATAVAVVSAVQQGQPQSGTGESNVVSLSTSAGRGGGGSGGQRRQRLETPEPAPPSSIHRRQPSLVLALDAAVSKPTLQLQPWAVLGLSSLAAAAAAVPPQQQQPAPIGPASVTTRSGRARGPTTSAAPPLVVVIPQVRVLVRETALVLHMHRSLPATSSPTAAGTSLFSPRGRRGPGLALGSAPALSSWASEAAVVVSLGDVGVSLGLSGSMPAVAQLPATALFLPSSPLTLCPLPSLALGVKAAAVHILVPRDAGGEEPLTPRTFRGTTTDGPRSEGWLSCLSVTGVKVAGLWGGGSATGLPAVAAVSFGLPPELETAAASVSASSPPSSPLARTTSGGGSRGSEARRRAASDTSGSSSGDASDDDSWSSEDSGSSYTSDSDSSGSSRSSDGASFSEAEDDASTPTAAAAQPAPPPAAEPPLPCAARARPALLPASLPAPSSSTPPLSLCLEADAAAFVWREGVFETWGGAAECLCASLAELTAVTMAAKVETTASSGRHGPVHGPHETLAAIEVCGAPLEEGAGAWGGSSVLLARPLQWHRLTAGGQQQPLGPDVTPASTPGQPQCERQPGGWLPVPGRSFVPEALAAVLPRLPPVYIQLRSVAGVVCLPPSITQSKQGQQQQSGFLIHTPLLRVGVEQQPGGATALAPCVSAALGGGAPASAAVAALPPHWGLQMDATTMLFSGDLAWRLSDAGSSSGVQGDGSKAASPSPDKHHHHHHRRRGGGGDGGSPSPSGLHRRRARSGSSSGSGLAGAASSPPSVHDAAAWAHFCAGVADPVRPAPQEALIMDLALFGVEETPAPVLLHPASSSSTPSALHCHMVTDVWACGIGVNLNPSSFPPLYTGIRAITRSVWEGLERLRTGTAALRFSAPLPALAIALDAAPAAGAASVIGTHDVLAPFTSSSCFSSYLDSHRAALTAIAERAAAYHNPPLHDPVELTSLARQLLPGGWLRYACASGQKLHRMSLNRIRAELSATAPAPAPSARAPASEAGLLLVVNVEAFASPNIPGDWQFAGVRLDLGGSPLIATTMLTVTPCLDGNRAMPADQGLRWLRPRLQAVQAAGGAAAAAWAAAGAAEHAAVSAAAAGDTGVSVLAQDLTVARPYGYHLGAAVDALAQGVDAATSAIAATGRDWWCPDTPRHWALFQREALPPLDKSGAALLPSSASQAVGVTHVWVRLVRVAIVVLDDPFESWVEAMVPVWRRYLDRRSGTEALAGRDFRRTHAATAAVLLAQGRGLAGLGGGSFGFGGGSTALYGAGGGGGGASLTGISSLSGSREEGGIVYGAAEALATPVPVGGAASAVPPSRKVAKSIASARGGGLAAGGAGAASGGAGAGGTGTASSGANGGGALIQLTAPRAGVPTVDVAFSEVCEAVEAAAAVMDCGVVTHRATLLAGGGAAGSPGWRSGGDGDSGTGDPIEPPGPSAAPVACAIFDPDSRTYVREARRAVAAAGEAAHSAFPWSSGAGAHLFPPAFERAAGPGIALDGSLPLTRWAFAHISLPLVTCHAVLSSGPAPAAAGDGDAPSQSQQQQQQRVYGCGATLAYAGLRLCCRRLPRPLMSQRQSVIDAGLSCSLPRDAPFTLQSLAAALRRGGNGGHPVIRGDAVLTFRGAATTYHPSSVRTWREVWWLLRRWVPLHLSRRIAQTLRAARFPPLVAVTPLLALTTTAEVRDFTAVILATDTPYEHGSSCRRIEATIAKVTAVTDVAAEFSTLDLEGLTVAVLPGGAGPAAPLLQVPAASGAVHTFFDGYLAPEASLDGSGGALAAGLPAACPQRKLRTWIFLGPRPQTSGHASSAGAAASVQQAAGAATSSSPLDASDVGSVGFVPPSLHAHAAGDGGALGLLSEGVGVTHSSLCPRWHAWVLAASGGLEGRSGPSLPADPAQAVAVAAITPESLHALITLGTRLVLSPLHKIRPSRTGSYLSRYLGVRGLRVSPPPPPVPLLPSLPQAPPSPTGAAPLPSWGLGYPVAIEIEGCSTAALKVHVGVGPSLPGAALSVVLASGTSFRCTLQQESVDAIPDPFTSGRVVVPTSVQQLHKLLEAQTQTAGGGKGGSASGRGGAPRGSGPAAATSVASQATVATAGGDAAPRPGWLSSMSTASRLMRGLGGWVSEPALSTPAATTPSPHQMSVRHLLLPSDTTTPATLLTGTSTAASNSEEEDDDAAVRELYQSGALRFLPTLFSPPLSRQLSGLLGASGSLSLGLADTPSGSIVATATVATATGELPPGTASALPAEVLGAASLPLLHPDAGIADDVTVWTISNVHGALSGLQVLLHTPATAKLQRRTAAAVALTAAAATAASAASSASLPSRRLTVSDVETLVPLLVEAAATYPDPGVLVLDIPVAAVKQTTADDLGAGGAAAAAAWRAREEEAGLDANYWSGDPEALGVEESIRTQVSGSAATRSRASSAVSGVSAFLRGPSHPPASSTSVGGPMPTMFLIFLSGIRAQGSAALRDVLEALLPAFTAAVTTALPQLGAPPARLLAGLDGSSDGPAPPAVQGWHSATGATSPHVPSAGVASAAATAHSAAPAGSPPGQASAPPFAAPAPASAAPPASASWDRWFLFSVTDIQVAAVEEKAGAAVLLQMDALQVAGDLRQDHERVTVQVAGAQVSTATLGTADLPSQRRRSLLLPGGAGSSTAPAFLWPSAFLPVTAAADRGRLRAGSVVQTASGWSGASGPAALALSPRHVKVSSPFNAAVLVVISHSATPEALARRQRAAQDARLLNLPPVASLADEGHHVTLSVSLPALDLSVDTAQYPIIFRVVETLATSDGGAGDGEGDTPSPSAGASGSGTTASTPGKDKKGSANSGPQSPPLTATGAGGVGAAPAPGTRKPRLEVHALPLRHLVPLLVQKEATRRLLRRRAGRLSATLASLQRVRQDWVHTLAHAAPSLSAPPRSGGALPPPVVGLAVDPVTWHEALTVDPAAAPKAPPVAPLHVRLSTRLLAVGGGGEGGQGAAGQFAGSGGGGAAAVAPTALPPRPLNEALALLDEEAMRLEAGLCRALAGVQEVTRQVQTIEAAVRKAHADLATPDLDLAARIGSINVSVFKRMEEGAAGAAAPTGRRRADSSVPAAAAAPDAPLLTAATAASISQLIPLFKLRVDDIRASCSGFGGRGSSVTLSVARVEAFDARPDAQYPVALTTWIERVARGQHVQNVYAHVGTGVTARAGGPSGASGGEVVVVSSGGGVGLGDASHTSSSASLAGGDAAQSSPASPPIASEDALNCILRQLGVQGLSSGGGGGGGVGGLGALAGGGGGVPGAGTSGGASATSPEARKLTDPALQSFLPPGLLASVTAASGGGGTAAGTAATAGSVGGIGRRRASSVTSTAGGGSGGGSSAPPSAVATIAGDGTTRLLPAWVLGPRLSPLLPRLRLPSLATLPGFGGRSTSGGGGGKSGDAPPRAASPTKVAAASSASASPTAPTTTGLSSLTSHFHALSGGSLSSLLSALTFHRQPRLASTLPPVTEEASPSLTSPSVTSVTSSSKLSTVTPPAAGGKSRSRRAVSGAPDTGATTTATAGAALMRVRSLASNTALPLPSDAGGSTDAPAPGLTTPPLRPLPEPPRPAAGSGWPGDSSSAPASDDESYYGLDSLPPGEDGDDDDATAGVESLPLLDNVDRLVAILHDTGGGAGEGNKHPPVLHVALSLLDPTAAKLSGQSAADETAVVVRHCEINVLPLRVAVASSLVHELVTFFKPPAAASSTTAAPPRAPAKSVKPGGSSKGRERGDTATSTLLHPLLEVTPAPSPDTAAQSPEGLLWDAVSAAALQLLSAALRRQGSGATAATTPASGPSGIPAIAHVRLLRAGPLAVEPLLSFEAAAAAVTAGLSTARAATSEGGGEALSSSSSHFGSAAAWAAALQARLQGWLRHSHTAAAGAGVGSSSPLAAGSRRSLSAGVPVAAPQAPPPSLADRELAVANTLAALGGDTCAIFFALTAPAAAAAAAPQAAAAAAAALSPGRAHGCTLPDVAALLVLCMCRALPGPVAAAEHVRGVLAAHSLTAAQGPLRSVAAAAGALLQAASGGPVTSVPTGADAGGSSSTSSGSSGGATAATTGGAGSAEAAGASAALGPLGPLRRGTPRAALLQLQAAQAASCSRSSSSSISGSPPPLRLRPQPSSFRLLSSASTSSRLSTAGGGAAVPPRWDALAWQLDGSVGRAFTAGEREAAGWGSSDAAACGSAASPFSPGTAALAAAIDASRALLQCLCAFVLATPGQARVAVAAEGSGAGALSRTPDGGYGVGGTASRLPPAAAAAAARLAAALPVGFLEGGGAPLPSPSSSSSSSSAFGVTGASASAPHIPTGLGFDALATAAATGLALLAEADAATDALLLRGLVGRGVLGVDAARTDPLEALLHGHMEPDARVWMLPRQQRGGSGGGGDAPSSSPPTALPAASTASGPRLSLVLPPPAKTPSYSFSRTPVLFRYLRLGEVQVLATYRGDGVFESLERLELKIHSKSYHSERLPAASLLRRLRNDIVKDVLRQPGRNLRNLGAFLADKMRGGGGGGGGGGGARQPPQVPDAAATSSAASSPPPAPPPTDPLSLWGALSAAASPEPSPPPPSVGGEALELPEAAAVAAGAFASPLRPGPAPAGAVTASPPLLPSSASTPPSAALPSSHSPAPSPPARSPPSRMPFLRALRLKSLLKKDLDPVTRLALQRELAELGGSGGAAGEA